MAVGDGSTEPEDDDRPASLSHKRRDHHKAESTADTSNDEDEDEEEEEPRLKYATLTRNVNALYRNGDATSAFDVVGDKMIVGTHNGNIHVFGLPAFNSIRVYRAHTASVSAISITSPPLSQVVSKQDAPSKLQNEASTAEKSPANSPAGKGRQQQTPVPDTPSNRIYIATSSIDGNVCISSLVDPRDVQLRNFGRPVQTVALSPDYKSDRTYLSGGQAGTLVLTVGGQAGKSSNATTTGAAAAASGWLGSIGLGANTGSDKVLHSGEGIINTIKWSPSGKYVVWVNEQGLKIMRTHLKLESHESGQEWKRFGHVDRPNRPGWEDMAGVWKARAEWVIRDNLEADDDSSLSAPRSTNGISKTTDEKPPSFEEVWVGWGDSAWLIRVYPGSAESSGSARVGRAERATM
jgi:vacuolar protein sorting-associated protein 41